MDLREQIEEVLNGIVDPCSGAAGVPGGLVDMGLVSTLELRPAGDGTHDVRVLIKVTEPGCIMGAPFVVEARTRLAGLPGIGAVDVGMDHAMDWTPEHMTPVYRERLESHRAKQPPVVPGGHVVRIVRSAPALQEGAAA